MKKSIFLFHGENNFQTYQKLKFWKEEFLKKFGEEALEIIEGKELMKTDFLTNIQALPFFSEKRMIIVKDFLQEKNKDEQKTVAENLDNSHESCLIIFYETAAAEKSNPIYKKIGKIGEIHELKDLKPPEINRWIQEKAKAENINIDFSTINYFSQHCGTNLWTLNNEMEKLKLFCLNNKISTEAINALCTPSLSSSIFKLIDFLAEKNYKKALQALEILHENNEDPIKIFFMIVRHFRILVQVLEMLQKNENQVTITKKLNQHPFVIQKAISQSRNFKIQEVQKIYEKLLEIDIKSKTGIIKSYANNDTQFKLAIEHFILDCCNVWKNNLLMS